MRHTGGTVPRSAASPAALGRLVCGSLKVFPSFIDAAREAIYIPAGRMFIIISILTLTSDTRRAVGPISSGCGRRPAAGGPLNGLSHHESGGGCCMGSVEHRGLHL
ncbi:uncharacterized protein AKAME5_001771400 [Lates japonicus]|uniref:Uncharacterized protein n=1 Tax=Lates japonicus TaxID=270547 RepID=A0AAD3N5E9_LATJO|nr:uncharacterized protein AKAME5_001771400 [Lates japonicus]